MQQVVQYAVSLVQHWPQMQCTGWLIDPSAAAPGRILPLVLRTTIIQPSANRVQRTVDLLVSIPGRDYAA